MNFSADSAVAGEICPAVNLGDRRGDSPIDMLVLHYTGMPDDKAALDWLTCAESEVSCHYLVFPDGAVRQMVPENKRAWHAGRSAWRGHEDVNSRSIGIEICNPGHEHGLVPYPETQILAVIDLCADILTRHEIPPRNVVGHSDVAPARKRDPGELFPWRRLAEKGIGHFVEPEAISGRGAMKSGDAGPAVGALQTMLSIYGYGIDYSATYDPATEQCVAAFQRHFRPERVDGIADRSTIATLDRLIRALASE